MNNFNSIESIESIVQCNSQAVFLDTGLSSSAFSKARLSNSLGEEGLLARAQKTESRQSAGCIKTVQYDFFSYKFDSTEINTEKSFATVCFKGEAFKGVSLSELLFTDKNKASLAIMFVCCALSQALTNDLKYLKKSVGCGGIVLGTSETGELTGDVLFLPPELFEEASVVRSDEVYSVLQGCFVNKAFEESVSKSLNFTLATLSYLGITGKMPYPALKTEIRNQDFLDSAFVHIDLEVNGIDTVLAKAINARLTNPQGDFEKEFPIEKLIHEMGLEAVPKATDGYVSAIKVPVSHKNMMKENVFAMKRSHALTLQNRQVKIKRFFRRYSTTVGFLTALIVIVGGLAVSYIHDRGREITTKGLTSSEVVKEFYTGLDKTDVSIIQNTTTGEADRKFSDSVAGLYVTAKTRTSYDQNAATKNLGEWLFFNNDLKYWIYGITQFTLDGEAVSKKVDAPEKNTKPKALSEENGVALKDGEKAQHTAVYYMVYNSGEDVLTVVKTTDIVNLVFKGDKWLVASIDSKGEPIETDIAAFKADYKAIKEECGDDVMLLSEKLREKYEWISREDELLEAAEELYRTYGLKSAKKALKL